MGRILVLLMMYGIIVAEKKCDQDQFLNKKGKCRPCRFCPPGEGMNFSVQVPNNEDGDPLACQPCSPCPDGYYNDPAADQYECSRCRLNCRLMNRKEYEPCGGTKSGKCGACLNSSYEDRDNNLDSPCYSNITAGHVQIGLGETNDEVVSDGKDYGNDDLKESSSARGWIYVVCVFSGLIILGAILSAGYAVFRKIKSFHRSASLVQTHSGSSLTGSSMNNGDQNNGISNGYQSLDELSVEIDGLAGDRAPHGEIEQYVSAGPEAMHISSEASFKETEPHRSYPCIVVKVGDIFFNCLAKQLHGNQVPNIFRELGLRDQKIYAALNLYELDRVSYEEAIHRLLLHWVRLKPAEARLDVLCPILDKAGLGEISQNLLQQVENLNSPTHRPNRIESIIMVEDNGIESYCSENIVEDNNLEQINETGAHEDTFNCCETEFGQREDSYLLDSVQQLSMTSFDTDSETIERETSL